MRPSHRALVVAGLVLALSGAAQAGGPPNPTHSDSQANTAGGTGVLDKNTAIAAQNTGFGFRALFSNTDGSNNTAVGSVVLNDNTTSANNTAVGQEALTFSHGVVNGFTANNNNTAVGGDALAFVTVGNFNTALSADAGSFLEEGDFNLYLGRQIFLHPFKESSTVRVGGLQSRTFIAGIFGTTVRGGTAVFISKDGQLGIRPSAAGYKRDIRALGTRSQGLYRLRPVTFRYTHDPEGQRQYGLLAEDVAQVYPELVVRGATGAVEAVQYEELIPLLLNEVQHKRHQVAALQARQARFQAALAHWRAAQRAQTAALAARLDKLEAAQPVTPGRR